MSDKIILTLDLSTKSSGWAIFEGDNLKDYGCITASSTNKWSRIDKMIENLKRILAEYKPQTIVIEDVIPADVGNKIDTYKVLTYLQGYVLHTLDNEKITDIIFYTSSEWRSKCGIKTGPGVRRDILKPKDVAFVKRQYGIDVNDDVADAIAIGYAFLHPVKQTSEIVDGFEFR